jgi:hypothetical protein
MPSGPDDEAAQQTGPSELQATEVFAAAGHLSLSFIPASRVHMNPSWSMVMGTIPILAVLVRP